jgi:[ribosomal protein S5]-alanine N-acetyltransferase
VTPPTSPTPLPLQAELPSLSTPRLVLRPIRESDAPDVFAYAKVPEVLRYTTGTPPRDLEDTRTFLRDALAAPNDRMWAMLRRGHDTVVGAIEFGVQSPMSASIHYALAKAYWGQGLMTEAVDAVCGWAFQALPSLLEIRTSVVEANVGSIRVLEKCGFTRVDTVREEWAKEREPATLAIFCRARSTIDQPRETE